MEQHLHQRRRVGVDLVGEVGQRRTAGEPDDLAVALGQADAADRGGLHRVELLALLPLRLAAALGRPTGTTERTRGTAATTTAATTGTSTATAGTATTGAEATTGRGATATGTAATRAEATATGTTTRTAGTAPGATTGTATGTTRPATGTTGTRTTTATSGPRRHHAGVGPRGHVARRRRPGATLTGTAGTRSTRTRRATGTRRALGAPALAGSRDATLLRGRSGRARTRCGGTRRGAGTDAERVVADTRGARAGLRGLRPRRNGAGIGRSLRGGGLLPLRSRRACSGGCLRARGGRRGRLLRCGLRRGLLWGLRSLARAGTRSRVGRARGAGGCRRCRGCGGRGRCDRRGRTLRAGHAGTRLVARNGAGGAATATGGTRGARATRRAGGTRRTGHGRRAGTRAGHGGRATGTRTTATVVVGTATGAAGITACQRLPQLAGDGGLDGGRGRLDVLPEVLQLAQDLLAADAELFGELVYAGLACHCTPCSSEAGGWSRSTSNLVSKHVHGAIFTTGS